MKQKQVFVSRLAPPALPRFPHATFELHDFQCHRTGEVGTEAWKILVRITGTPLGVDPYNIISQVGAGVVPGATLRLNESVSDELGSSRFEDSAPRLGVTAVEDRMCNCDNALRHCNRKSPQIVFTLKKTSPRCALEAARVNNLAALLSLAVKVHEVRDVGKLMFDVADGGVPADAGLLVIAHRRGSMGVSGCRGR